MTSLKNLIQKHGAEFFVAVAYLSIGLFSFRPFWHNETKLPDCLKQEFK